MDVDNANHIKRKYLYGHRRSYQEEIIIEEKERKIVISMKILCREMHGTFCGDKFKIKKEILMERRYCKDIAMFYLPALILDKDDITEKQRYHINRLFWCKSFDERREWPHHYVSC